jgi:hypothetical protein
MVEYAVVLTAPGNPVIENRFDSLEMAEQEVKWLYAWKEDRRQAAEEEAKREEEGPPLQGNWDRMAWSHGDIGGGRPIKDREWAISKREVGEWERVNW